jgi:hypothetical protein
LHSAGAKNSNRDWRDLAAIMRPSAPLASAARFLAD